MRDYDNKKDCKFDHRRSNKRTLCSHQSRVAYFGRGRYFKQYVEVSCASANSLVLSITAAQLPYAKHDPVSQLLDDLARHTSIPLDSVIAMESTSENRYGARLLAAVLGCQPPTIFMLVQIFKLGCVERERDETMFEVCICLGQRIGWCSYGPKEQLPCPHS